MSVVTAHMVYFCAFAHSEIFQKNARKLGVGRGQFHSGINGLKTMSCLCSGKQPCTTLHSSRLVTQEAAREKWCFQAAENQCHVCTTSQEEGLNIISVWQKYRQPCLCSEVSSQHFSPKFRIYKAVCNTFHFSFSSGNFLAHQDIDKISPRKGFVFSC